MAKKIELFREVISTKLINAKREKENIGFHHGGNIKDVDPSYHEWAGQAIMAQQLLDILDGKQPK